MRGLSQEELYRQLYEAAPLAQFAIGVDGSIHSCNQAADAWSRTRLTPGTKKVLSVFFRIFH